jgi:hypothetical protein
MGRYVFTRFCMLLDQEFHLEKYYGGIVSSHMWIFVDKPIYTWQNTQSSEIQQLQYNKSDLCNIINRPHFAKGPSYNHTERQPV